MRLCSVKRNHEVEGALELGGKLVSFRSLSKSTGIDLPISLFDVLTDEVSQGKLRKAHDALIKQGSAIEETMNDFKFAAPYYAPPKIWGIGLNYKEHAADLGAKLPDEPASFMKPRTTIIGPGETIKLPSQSKRVTAEAELGIIIGKRCKNIAEDKAESVVFGYVPIIDMTAEDILQRNPRFLTVAKSFDTFFSFGPMILTPDEIKDIQNLSVTTVHNSHVEKTNKISNMIFSLNKLISFHSKVMTMEPGDIISTGTPGAVVISDGDTVEARIDNFPTLSNNVKRA